MCQLNVLGLERHRRRRYLYDGRDWGWAQAIEPGVENMTVSCPTTKLCMAGDQNGTVLVGTPAKA